MNIFKKLNNYLVDFFSKHPQLLQWAPRVCVTLSYICIMLTLFKYWVGWWWPLNYTLFYIIIIQQSFYIDFLGKYNKSLEQLNRFNKDSLDKLRDFQIANTFLGKNSLKIESVYGIPSYHKYYDIAYQKRLMDLLSHHHKDTTSNAYKPPLDYSEVVTSNNEKMASIRARLLADLKNQVKEESEPGFSGFNESNLDDLTNQMLNDPKIQMLNDPKIWPHLGELTKQIINSGELNSFKSANDIKK